MDTDRKWVVVRIDGKIAAVSTDYKALAGISGRLASAKNPGDSVKYSEIIASTVSFEEVWKLRQETGWDDIILFGTEFQKKIWRKLWDLSHREDMSGPDLISYSDFAELCQNRAGVRAVAHAIGMNPLSVIIPCHVVVPKESIDKIRQIQKKAEATIFKGEDLCLDSLLRDKSIDFGEYSLGRRLKRELIVRELQSH